MPRMTKAQWEQYIKQWQSAAPRLEQIRREKLRRLEYEFPVVNALLEIGDRFGQTRPTSGLVEMQNWFRLLEERQKHTPKTPGGELSHR